MRPFRAAARAMFNSIRLLEFEATPHNSNHCVYISIQIFLFWASGRVGGGSASARHLVGGVQARKRRKSQKTTERVRKRSKKLENPSPLANSGLGPEIRYFQAPETHFQPFRGSGPKFAIFELLRPIFWLFGALARNSLFSSS